MYYFISYTLFPEQTIPLKKSPLVHFSIWLSIVTSPQLLALWRYVRQLFLHAQIGANAIFISE